ncbi:hypothetical protein WICPIJ_006360 [Wickerhamomyces pijperi]|uniref:Uncharacterized protein n=1 Tax=Wickerhamomyces pijperi TaxID=599730 RepID=A0A9P8TKX9_WICPI|nr:hypothetical protein WICPIJ_006360 [Wickerhamomyces pijperi]
METTENSELSVGVSGFVFLLSSLLNGKDSMLAPSLKYNWSPATLKAVTLVGLNCNNSKEQLSMFTSSNSFLCVMTR